MTTAPATSEFALVGVDHVHPHPRNVRRNITGVDELAESIKAGGLHQPLVVAPADPDDGDAAGYILVMGHRRLAAAQSLEWSEVPCVIRYDLDTDTKVLEAMLAENMARSDLSPTEEGDAFQALLDLDVTPARIAKAASRSAKHVRDRITVAGQPEKVRQAVDDRQISLANALTLAELEDDHELYTRVERAIGTPQFDYEVKRAAAIRANIKAEADQRAELVAAGFVEATERELSALDDPVGGYRLERVWDRTPDIPAETLRFTLDCPNPEYGAPRLQWFRLVPVEPEGDSQHDDGGDGSPVSAEDARIADWHTERVAAAEATRASLEVAAQERDTAAGHRRKHLSALWNVDLQTADTVWAPVIEQLLRRAVAERGYDWEPLSELAVIVDPADPVMDANDPRLSPASWSALQLQFTVWWCRWAAMGERELSNYHPSHWEPETATYLETLRDLLEYELTDIEEALLDTYHSIHSGDGDD